MMTLKPHIKTAVAYFLVAAVLGVILRSFLVFEIPITYKFFVHAHSHVALLGWVYTAMTTLIYLLFIQKKEIDKKYKRIFWFTQITLIGMLFTFPFTGYALYSIIFSTLFLFASYWFYGFFLKYTSLEIKKTKSYLCVKTALLYMVISSIGPWVLGVIMNTLGAESIWYRLAIYFYLHFQYNGWMILALVGIFFFTLEQQQNHISKKDYNRFFLVFNIGIVLTFFLSALFTEPFIVLYVLGGAGAILQLVALVLLIRIFSNPPKVSTIFNSSYRIGLLHLVVVILGIKMLLQLVSAIPYFARLAATVLDFTIGYLHLTFLGVITIAIFLLIDYYKLLVVSKKALWLYLIAFVLTELLIFYKGIVAWLGWSLLENYFTVLWAASLLIPVSLVLLVLQSKQRKEQ